MKENRINIQKQIDFYVKGMLSEEEIMELWKEFALNPELLDDLELEVGVKKLVKDGVLSSKTNEKAKITRLPSWTWHAAAAAVLVLVISTQLFQVDSRTELSQFVTSSISPDQLETGDGVRAKEMVLSVADSLLNLGFEASLSGNTSRALMLYDQVITNYDIEPYGSKAFTNRGIVLYNQSEFNTAIEAFDSALVRVYENRMVEEKAFWYKGNALVNIEKFDEARIAIIQAYSLEGIFRKPAFLLLQKLNYDLGYVNYDDYENQVKDN